MERTQRAAAEGAAPMAWVAGWVIVGALWGGWGWGWEASGWGAEKWGGGEWGLWAAVGMLGVWGGLWWRAGRMGDAGRRALWQRAGSVALAGAAVAVGAGLMRVELGRVAAEDVGRVAGVEGRLGGVLVRAELMGLSEVRMAGDGGRAVTGRAAVVGVNGEKRTGVVRVMIEEVGDDPELPGGRWEGVGVLSRPRGAMNPGEADFARASAIEGISAELRIESLRQVRSIRGEEDEAVGGSTAGLLEGWREWVRGRLGAGSSGGVDGALLRSLLLGDPDPRLGEVREAFERTGTTHHLAVSGTHLAVMGGFVYGVVRALMLVPGVGAWVTPRRAVGVTVGVLVLYGTAVAGSPAVTRAVGLSVLVGVALMSRRGLGAGGGGVVNLLGVCAVGQVAAEPGVLLTPGFQLSYGVVWALVRAGPEAVRWVGECRDRDYVVADAWRPGTWGAFRRRWGWRLGAAVGVSVVAGMAAGPVVACHFGQANPWAAVASVALAPVVFAAIVAGAVKVVVSAVVPWGAEAWAWGAEGMAGMMRGCVEVLARVPGSEVGVPGIGGGWAVVMLGAMVFPLLPRVRGSSWRVRGAVWGVVAAVTLGGPMAVRVWPGGEGVEGEVRVAVLEVGGERAGSCVVIEDGAGGVVVVDAGAGRGGWGYRRVVEPYLRERRVGRIDALVLTRPEAETASVEGLLRRREVGEAITTPQAARAERLAPVLEGRAVRSVVAGETLRFGRVTLDVLHPPTDTGLSATDAAMVMRVAAHGRVVLLAGTVSEAGTREVLLRRHELTADVVVVPGGKRSAGLAEASEAGVVVVTGEGEAEAGRGARVLRTEEAGAVTVRIAGDGGMGVEGFRGGR